ncbi:CAMK family protein kinase [Tritrichomonas foetus]|uniref:CAMK family protein kinase n=1 Tax=Tritrichomonas foetus TaxID=1144522 RepID=A0A1J4KEB5_9EUKA|nr:CAMK family protein kinase [Tritrichomonas foetus]|eukprot:OHT09256.1 CAMK family protein kinase [Tritrichomonas foetus]
MGCCCSKKKVYNEHECNDEEEEEICEEMENYAYIPQYFSFQQFFSEETPPQLYEYLFKKEIGKGAMSRVYLAENVETQELYAAKVYNKRQLEKQTFGNDETLGEQVEREIRLMAKMKHRYILIIIEAIDFADANAKILLTPFAQNGTLQTQLNANTMDIDMIAICFHQVAVGLKYIHNHNIVHRDIKPDNILCFSENYFVISDFSASTELTSSDQTLEDTKGSPAFLSPEECSGNAFHPKPCDVWSYGIALYSAAFKKLPFNLESGQGKTVATTVLIVTELIEKETLQFPEDQEVNPKLRKLLTDVLQKDPTKRPTFEEIVKYDFFEKAWPIDEENAREAKMLEEEEEEANEENVDQN